MHHFRSSRDGIYGRPVFRALSFSNTERLTQPGSPCLLSVLALENSISNVITTGSTGPIDCCCLGRAKADHHGGDLVHASRHPTSYPRPYLLLLGSASTTCSLPGLGRCHDAQFALQSGIVLPRAEEPGMQGCDGLSSAEPSGLYIHGLYCQIYGSRIMTPTRHLNEQTCEVWPRLKFISETGITEETVPLRCVA